ncbi:MAG: precorrin-6y C5,15-methyltransferase (decarboxylating) subunit CbiE [bacterium]
MKALGEWLHIVGINPVGENPMSPCPEQAIFNQQWNDQGKQEGSQQGGHQRYSPFLLHPYLPDDTVLLVGAQRLQGLFPGFGGERLLLKGNLDSLIAQLKSYRGKSVVVLASGDPNFYGIASTLLQHIDPQEIAIYPAVSSMQWAFAKAKIPWHDASLISLHGRPLHHLARVWPSRKIGIFTDGCNTPARIAAFLLDRGVCPDECRCFLFENLGQKHEKMTQGTLSDLSKRESDPLNILLIMGAGPKNPFSRYPVPGLPEEEFFHTAGLITKREVRTALLSYLRPQEDSILWDIGAGSGSVSIEASRFIRSGIILAVEKKPAEVENIIKNRQKFQTLNLEVISGEAPSILAELPDPDRIFLGGSGRSLGPNLETCWQRLKKGGRIGVNVITLESLAIAKEFLCSQAASFDMTAIQISRKKDLAGLTVMEPSPAVYILVGEK